jgi:hypothetical protein
MTLRAVAQATSADAARKFPGPPGFSQYPDSVAPARDGNDKTTAHAASPTIPIERAARDTLLASPFRALDPPENPFPSGCSREHSPGRGASTRTPVGWVGHYGTWNSANLSCEAADGRRGALQSSLSGRRKTQSSLEVARIGISASESAAPSLFNLSAASSSRPRTRGRGIPRLASGLVAATASDITPTSSQPSRPNWFRAAVYFLSRSDTTLYSQRCIEEA